VIDSMIDFRPINWLVKRVEKCS